MFYLPLDELKDNEPVQGYTPVVTARCTGEAGVLPVMDFDSYKGSHLLLKAGASLEVLPAAGTTLPLGVQDAYVFNFYFSYSKAQELDVVHLFTLNNDIRLTAGKYRQVNALVLHQGAEEIGVLQNKPGEVYLREKRWYNLGVCILPDGQVQLIPDNGVPVTLPKKLYLGDRRLVRLRMGGENPADTVLRIGDLYLLQAPGKEQLEYIARKGVNPNLRAEWLNTLGFDLMTRQDGQDKQGLWGGTGIVYLQIINSHPALQLVPVEGSKDQVVLRFKKGVVSFRPDNLAGTVWQLRETVTETELFAPLTPGVLLMQLPPVVLTDFGQAYALVQCQLQHLQLEATNYVAPLHTPLYFDKKINLYPEEQGKRPCPFEVVGWVGDVLLNDGVTRQAIRLRLCNVSGETVRLPAPGKVPCTFSIEGPADLFVKENFRDVRMVLGSYNCRKQPDALSVELLQSAELAPGSFLDILAEGLLVRQPTAGYPSGTYHFHLAYRNLPGYVNGTMAFYLKTAGKTIRSEAGNGKHYLEGLTSLESGSADIQSLSADILKLRKQLDLLAASFTVTLQGKNLLNLTEQTTTIHTKELKLNNELVTALPVGTIIAFAGNRPEGWLKCDGEPFDSNIYKKLYDVLRSSRTPNLQNRFLRGGTDSSKGQVGGATEMRLSENHIPRLFSQNQFVNGVQVNRNTDAGKWGPDAELVNNVSVSYGQVQVGRDNPDAFSMLPPYYTVVYLIKAL